MINHCVNLEYMHDTGLAFAGLSFCVGPNEVNMDIYARSACCVMPVVFPVLGKDLRDIEIFRLEVS
jgi:hypothetical protein